MSSHTHSAHFASSPAGERQRAAGLVELVTSQTWNPLDPENQRKKRLSRMRRATLNGGDQITSGLQLRGFRYKSAMVTLTYRPEVLWDTKHVSGFLDHCRKYLARRGFPLLYVWVAELQQRGAVHYHVVLWLPKGITLPKPDKQGWWKHGSTRIEWARRPVAYLAKYTSKGEDVRKFPRGLRLHGRGGLILSQRRVVSWWLLPRYVRDHFPHVGSHVTRVIGGGWVSHETGEWLEAWRPPDG